MSLLPPPEKGADLWLVNQSEPGLGAGVLDIAELDEAERTRAAGYRHETERILYTVTHIALRRLLGAYLDTAPRALRFGRAPCACGDPNHGRPVLQTPQSALHFSLSHGHGMALIGISTTPIGVDIERIPARETARVCLPALHPAEQAELRSACDADGPDTVRFGQLWTRKEAYLKGIGTGLARDLSADYLGEDHRRRPAAWTVIDVPCGPGHLAAAALQRTAHAEPPRMHYLPTDRLYKNASVPLGSRDTFLGELVA